MTILTPCHSSFPRVGLRRELKKSFQRELLGGNSTREALLAVGRELRARHWGAAETKRVLTCYR